MATAIAGAGITWIGMIGFTIPLIVDSFMEICLVSSTSTVPVFLLVVVVIWTGYYEVRHSSVKMRVISVI